MQVSDNQKNAAISSITEAGIKAYCESYGIPTEVMEGIVGIDLNLVRRQAKAMTTELDRIIMAHVGPQLIRFWSHQGCPELPPLQK